MCMELDRSSHRLRKTQQRHCPTQLPLGRAADLLRPQTLSALLGLKPTRSCWRPFQCGFVVTASLRAETRPGSTQKSVVAQRCAEIQT